MPTLQVIQTTKTLWAVSPQVPSMLRSPSELHKAGQGKQSRANVCCDCSGERLSKERRNHQGIEITTTSYYERGFE